MATGIAAQVVRGAHDIATRDRFDLIKDHIRQTIMTEAGDRQTGGEIPWMQSFGSRLHKLRHRGITDRTLSLARALTTSAIQTWVPEVRLVQVTTEKDVAVANAIRIRVTYQVIDTGVTDEVVTTTNVL